MKLTLQRKWETGHSTIGELSVDGVFECFTLEDVRRPGPKIYGETAIPPGTYDVVITRSQRFQRMLPLLVNVPDFTGIRIHPGNTAKDTDGCILVGRVRNDDLIMSSVAALDALQPKIAAALAQGDRVTIAVRDPLPAAPLPLSA